MKKIFMVCWLIIANVHCFGQDLPDLQKYSRDIGFNTAILFNGILNSSGGPFDLLYKNQMTASTARRLGASIYVNNSSNINIYYSPGYATNTSYKLSFSVGKEFQKQITKRWIFYYGGDIAPFVNYEQVRTYNFYNNLPNPDYRLFNEGKSTSYGLQLLPFLGIRFAINERLYVATEARLKLSLNGKDSYQKALINSPDQYVELKNNFIESNLTFNPAAGISVFYRF